MRVKCQSQLWKHFLSSKLFSLSYEAKTKKFFYFFDLTSDDCPVGWRMHIAKHKYRYIDRVPSKVEHF